MGVIIGTGEEIWSEGYVFGTIVGGAADDIPFAEMQDFSLRDDITLVEVMGATRTGAVAVGHKSSAITGICKWLRVRLRQFQMVRGGVPTHNTGISTYARGINTSPVAFNMHFFGPQTVAPIDTELKCYNGVAPSLNVPLAQRDFALPDIGYNIYGNATAFYELLRPGNHTSS